MTPTPDYSTWFTKQVAASTIGVSTKTIENLAAQNKVASALWRNPAGGPQIRVYAPDDVQRLATARQDSGSPRFSQGPVNGSALHGPATTVGLAIPAAGGPMPALSNILEVFARSQKELSENLASKNASEKLAWKFYLTIKEAAEVSGLSQAFIRRACVDGKLDAIRDGQVWKIRRAALAAL
jgi:excisionase family DNA binding protein